MRLVIVSLSSKELNRSWSTLLSTLSERDCPGPGDDAPDLGAAHTENSVTEAEAHGNGATVVHSLSVGADNPSALRTAWLIGVDQLAWNDGAGRLIVVAAGNVPVERMVIDAEDYPATNLVEPMCQPAQAWNALTVGGYTALAGAPAVGTGVYPRRWPHWAASVPTRRPTWAGAAGRSSPRL